MTKERGGRKKKRIRERGKEREVRPFVLNDVFER